ncbi:MAG: hypothetical protein NTU92_07805 [Methylotenera sp.]|nr:hypothetical protein [Methylotenera sp.]
MSMLLRSMLALGLIAVFVVGCEQKVVTTPSVAPTIPVATPVSEKEVTGGYEPTAEERIPGITIDAAALDAALIAAEADTATATSVVK